MHVNQSHSQLYRLLLQHFNTEDLKNLCFEVSIDYEELGGNIPKSGKLRELLLLLKRNGRLAHLIPHLQDTRPNVDWQLAYDEEDAVPPFKGLLSFEPEDADIFFGRERLTAELIAHLCEHNFLAVVGASGNGKSSVVKAGVIPVLLGDKQLKSVAKLPDGAMQWEIHLITPTERPLKELAATLTRDSESVTATKTLMNDLLADSASLDLFVSKRLKQQGKRGLLLIVDQFEELFTGEIDTDEAKAARIAFIDNLLTAVSPQTAGPTRLIITLRADFYSHLFVYPELRERIVRYQINIGSMSREELCEVIRRPSERGDYQWEAGLVDVLLKDVGATLQGEPEPGTLPLLSHA